MSVYTIVQGIKQLITNAGGLGYVNIFTEYPRLLEQSQTPALTIWESGPNFEMRDAGGNNAPPFGLKRAVWEIDCHVVLMIEDNVGGATTFRNLLETTKVLFRQHPDLSHLADTSTSKVMQFAEQIRTITPVPIINRGKMAFNAHLLCTVEEFYSA